MQFLEGGAGICPKFPILDPPLELHFFCTSTVEPLNSINGPIDFVKIFTVVLFKAADYIASAEVKFY